jgi:tryptophan-rich sensory protein
MKLNKSQKIIILVVICLVLGFTSGLITKSAITDWYPTIKKPIFNPPNGVFGPVWTMLYIMMAVAAALIWNVIDSNKNAKTALKYFAIQLFLNVLWSILFFGLHNPAMAFIEIIILWALIFKTYIEFKKINTIAAYLLLPYLFWVSFATILNGSIWFLNK